MLTARELMVATAPLRASASITDRVQPPLGWKGHEDVHSRGDHTVGSHR
jgi:hypothetical protein